MWKKNKKHQTTRPPAMVVESLEARELFWVLECVPPPTEIRTGMSQPTESVREAAYKPSESLSPAGTNMLMCDGSVRFVSVSL